MAAEPINIFSRKIDPRGVVQTLRKLAPTLQLIGPEDAWEKIIITGPKRFLRKSPSLTFTHDAEYYDDPGWARQIRRIRGTFDNSHFRFWSRRNSTFPADADALREPGLS